MRIGIPGPFFFLLFALIVANQVVIAQPAPNDFDKWAENLSSKRDDKNASYDAAIGLVKADSAKAFEFIHNVLQSVSKPNQYFHSRINCLTAFSKIFHHQYRNKSEIILLAEDALRQAYQTDDDQLIAHISFTAGTLMIPIKEMERAVTYLAKGQDIFDRLGNQTIKEKYSNWVIMGEVLFHCRDYEKSIFYTRKVIEIYNDTIANADYYRARFFNTLGQNYVKLSMPDSALANFRRSLRLAANVNDSVWQAINSGFIGQVLCRLKDYDKAIPLLQLDYEVNKTRALEHAAKSLEWLARIDIERGNLAGALSKATEALALIRKAGGGYYLQQDAFLESIYQTIAEVYRSMNNSDSFTRYNLLAETLHDSLQTVATLSSLKIAQLRIDSDNNRREIQTLIAEKQTERLKLQFLIVSIVLFLIILFLYFNRQRLKQIHKAQLLLQQQRAAEAELDAARNIMHQFKENIVEKTSLIESLEKKLNHKERNTEQQRLIEEISHHTILTEQDWQRFKSLFEKIYPGFFINLKERAPDITLAELRMAALTRLNLTTRQMASMLGISTDSVHKTRQRLRQRLHIPAEADLEALVSLL